MATNNYPRSKRKPLGKVKPWSDAELDALSAITPQDIEAARVFWETNVPERWKNLLDAQVMDAQKKPTNS